MAEHKAPRLAAKDGGAEGALFLLTFFGGKKSKISDGRYYGYLPPVGPKRTTPRPKDKEEWLLVFVSARNGDGPLTVVGWYEHAILHEEYFERPEYSESEYFEFGAEGEPYYYCMSTDTAYLIPTGSRTDTVPGKHFKRTPILYVRGNGKDDAWRDEFAKFAESLVAKKRPENSHPPKLSFPDPKQRKLVEEAAIQEAKKLLEKKYQVIDRQKDNCGYDLLARHRKTKEELHVEVKGTSGSNMRFYMTRNEFRYMSMPQWRLIIVCDALAKPKATMLNAKEVQTAFNIEPFAWEAIAK